MASTIRYFIGGLGNNVTDLRSPLNEFSLLGETFVFTGSGLVNTVYAAPGVVLDARNLLGGEDVVFFSYNWSAYTKDMTSIAGAIVFSATVNGVTERVIVPNGATAAGKDKLVFADGSVITDKAKLALTTSLTATTTDIATHWNSAITASNPGSALPTTLNATLRGFASTSVGDTSGATFIMSEVGVQHVITGTALIDKVYVKTGANVDARNLLGGADVLYFTGSWAEYTKDITTVSGAIKFTRTVNAVTETILVSNGATAAGKDLLVFADGAVITDKAKLALTGSLTVALSAVTGYDILTKTPGLLEIQNITITNDVRASGFYKAGETITFAIDFKDVVTVAGTPKLKIVVGSTEHLIDYIGSANGNKRLLFQYQVQLADADLDGVSIPNGSGAFVLDAGVSIKYANSTDASLDHDPVTTLKRAKIDNSPAPNAPTISSVTDNAGITESIANGGSSNDATPTVRVSLSGTNAKANDSVQLYDNLSALGAATTLTLQNINDGYVDITLSPLPEGLHSFTATVVSVTDLVSSTSSGYAINLDFTAPAVSIAFVTDDTDPQAGTVNNGGYSNDTQLTVRVNLIGSAIAIGETLQLFNGSTAISTLTAVTAQNKTTDGYIDITTTTLTHGTTYAITVRATDQWGNSCDSATHTVTVDTVAPTAVTLALQQDTGSNATDNITHNGAITISGMEVGTTWEYSTNSGTSWVAGNGGATSTTNMSNLTLVADSYTTGSVMVRQTDQAGNVGATAALGNVALVQQRLQGTSGIFLDDNAPQLMAMANGGYVLTWYGLTSDGKSYDVFVRRFDANNVAVGSVQRLQGTTTGGYLDQYPQTTALSDGSYVVTWQGQTSDNQGYDTYAQHFTADNALSGGTQRLQGMAGLLDDTAPQITALTNGAYVLAWCGTTSDSQGSDVFVQVVGSNNANVGSLQRLSSTSGNFSDDQAQITALTGGGFVVAWRAYKTSGSWDRDIVVQRFDSTGNALGSSQKLGDLGSYNEDDVPQLLALSDGGYVVLWQGYVPADGASNILVQRFDSNGAAVGAQLGLQGMSGSSLYDYEPQAAALAGGSYVIAWSGHTSDSQAYDVFVQLVGSNNLAVGSPQRFQGIAGTYPDTVPQITALSGGGYVVAWQGATSDAGTDIFVQQFSSTGQTVGNMQRLQGLSGTALNDTAPQLTALADGGYVVTWQGATNNNQSTDIFTQRFDAQGNYAKTLTVDTTTPSFSSGSVSGSVMSLIYSESLDANALPDINRFTVISGGSVIAVTSVLVSGSTLTLNLASRVGYQKVVTVAYADPTAGDDANAVQDKAGNDAVTLAALTVTNNSQFVAPSMSLLVDTGSSSTDGITSNGTVKVSGLEAGATWQYSIDWGSTWIAGTGSSFSLVDGSYSGIYIKQNLNTLTSSNGYYSGTVTVDTVAPTSVIKGFDKSGSTWNGITVSYLTDIVGAGMTHTADGNSALLEGTTEAYASITFSIGGQSHTAVADYSGYWYYRLTDTDFANVGYGAETITVSGATDRAGNASTVQVTRNVTFNAVADTMSHAQSGYGSDYVDALIYGGAGWKGTTITYSFAPGSGATAWTATEKQAFANACHAYENICNLHFVEGTYYADNYSETSMVLNKVPSSTWTAQPGWVVLADFNLPTDGFNSYYGALQGRFNYEYSAWNNLTPGSLGFNTIIHELGHGLGMAHPFDGVPTFPGVTYGDLIDMGDYSLNQGAWSIMTYSHDWDGSPASSIDWGYGKTPMTFDVAAMQTMYGANTNYRTGDNVYQLPTTDATGTGWECIWDAGGTDTISNAGASTGSYINLNAYPKTGGLVSEPYVSYNYGTGGDLTPSLNIAGGFTIADGAMIENAIGGNGADKLTGNGVNNTLTGNAGADKFVFNTTLGTSNVDTIVDFTVGSDQIQLDDAVFSALIASTAVAVSQFLSGSGLTAAIDANDFLIYNTSTGALYYDADGSATGYTAIQFALLQNKAALTTAQFVVI